MAYFIPNPTAFSVIPDFSSAPAVSGFHLDFISTTQMFLNPGYARAFGSDFPIVYPSIVPNAPSYILLDTTVVGAGGCFPFAISDMTLASNTVFGIYVIAKSSGTTDGSLNPSVNVSAVIATGDNFLPPGYDAFRRVALCYVDSSTNLLIKWIQSGFSNDRQYMAQDAVRVLTAGNATTYTLIDLTTGNGIVPPGHANYAELTLSLNPAVVGDELEVTASVLTPGTLAAVSLVGNVASQTIQTTGEIVCGIAGGNVFATNTNAAINYKVTNVGDVANIWVSGFTDSLGNNLF
jgi:hypothetical protein